MDGNGRWAKARGEPRAFGHYAGAETVRRVAAHAIRRGIPFLTLYAFSTENWSRPREEVDALMALMAEFLESELPVLMKNDIRLRVLGDAAALPAELTERIRHTTGRTAANRTLALSLAVNYGGRDEILRAARRLAAEAREGNLDPAAIDAAAFAERLDTRGLPDPDLVIRTAGEMRLSNFLIWQAAYAELYFCDRCWPDFSDEDFDEALWQYGERTRKFGGL